MVIMLFASHYRILIIDSHASKQNWNVRWMVILTSNRQSLVVWPVSWLIGTILSGIIIVAVSTFFFSYQTLELSMETRFLCIKSCLLFKIQSKYNSVTFDRFIWIFCKTKHWDCIGPHKLPSSQNCFGCRHSHRNQILCIDLRCYCNAISCGGHGTHVVHRIVAAGDKYLSLLQCSKRNDNRFSSEYMKFTLFCLFTCFRLK